MGKIFGKILCRMKDTKIVMVGLDAAGKSTILYRMKMKSTTETIPTVGFNVESFKFKDVSFTVWDVGGQSQIRPLWRHYYAGTQALIFVVDSTDRDRIDEARTELTRILNDSQLRNVVALVYANKQDLPGAMGPEEVEEKLGLAQIGYKRWHVQPSCARTGEGIVEGLAWISDNMRVIRRLY